MTTNSMLTLSSLGTEERGTHKLARQATRFFEDVWGPVKTLSPSQFIAIEVVTRFGDHDGGGGDCNGPIPSLSALPRMTPPRLVNLVHAGAGEAERPSEQTCWSRLQTAFVRVAWSRAG